MRIGRLALVLLLAAFPLTARASGDDALRLQQHYQELRDLARHGPFGVPLSVQSEVGSEQVSAEVSGIIEHPFELVRATLIDPAAWCDFAPLHENVKACTYQGKSTETLLTLYLGRKYYLTPQSASPQTYRFSVQKSEPDFLSVSLTAAEGVYGTSAHQFELEAAGVDGRTMITLRSSYVPSTVTKLMTTLYLATLGRKKVGFSLEPGVPPAAPQYIKGFRGLVERSAMRYYLAFQTYLDMETAPAAHRFEACINAVYDSMERYPRQLHELEKADYLDIKRRERENQLRLQQRIGPAGTKPAAP